MSELPRSSATDRLIEHVTTQRFEALPAPARAAARTFVLDSLGVALAGTRVPYVAALKEVAATWGAGAACRIWGTGERVPPGAAAFVNGYQIHNQEFDCVHEAAVVHPMAVVLAALVAWGEAQGGVCGRQLVLGCSVAVDVAATIGMAARGRLRFFRPAMCGALGATAGIAAIAGLGAQQTRSALGLTYSQLSGTMQAHVEGSPVLPMQIGFNARAALTSIELAARGVRGPLDFLEGPFGYFALIEGEWEPQVLAGIGRTQRIAELSHKPFPSGRATHGGVDAVLSLQRAHGFTAAAVAEVRVHAPPLVIQLVDRPARADMAPPYARLCLPYVAATALLTGTVGVEDFEPAALADPERLALAARIRVVPDGNPSLNALSPQRVQVELADGTTHELALPAVLGHPERPLTREQHLEKFRRAARSGSRPLPDERIERLIDRIDALESLGDVRSLVDELMF